MSGEGVAARRGEVDAVLERARIGRAHRVERDARVLGREHGALELLAQPLLRLVTRRHPVERLVAALDAEEREHRLAALGRGAAGDEDDALPAVERGERALAWVLWHPFMIESWRRHFLTPATAMQVAR